jgi:hypothetical protein
VSFLEEFRTRKIIFWKDLQSKLFLTLQDTEKFYEMTRGPENKFVTGFWMKTQQDPKIEDTFQKAAFEAPRLQDL